MSAPSDTAARLIQLAARRFKKNAAEIRPEDDLFERLGIDSIQSLELLSELEQEFEVEIPDYELQGVKTFAALAAKIDQRR